MSQNQKNHPSFTTNRRSLLLGAASAAAGIGIASLTSAADQGPKPTAAVAKLTANTLAMKDGTVIYYKDWGSGPVVVFSHGYPLSSDTWENQMLFLSQNGYRVIAHDRRGFGRSSQPSGGYDFDTFSDDLSTLIEALDVSNITLVGHSMGGGEVARYVGRYGESRVARVALVGAVTPFLLKTATNPNGAPMEIFDGMRSGVLANRAQFFRDIAPAYYNYNRAGSKSSEGVVDQFWRQAMSTGMLATYYALGAFAETDFRTDLQKITVPTLVVHGDDDQVTPLEISGKPTAALVKHAKLITYAGGSHGLVFTQKDQLNSDLLEFLRSS